MTPQQENKVIKDIPQAFEELNNLSLEERNWLTEFEGLSSSDLKTLVKVFERSQSLSITKAFHSLDDKIFIPKLGVFYIKEAKLDLVRLTGQDPCKLNPLTHSEVIAEIKRLYLERATSGKNNNRNKTLYVNINSISTER